MKGNIGVIRQVYCIGARSKYTHQLQATLPTLNLAFRSNGIHTSAQAAYTHPSHPISTEHHLDRASPSSSRAGNAPPPPPLPIRKRNTVARTSAPSHLRVSTKEQHKSNASPAIARAPTTSSSTSKPDLALSGNKGKEKEREMVSNDKARILQTSSAIPAASEKEGSSSQNKEAAPRKTILQRIKSLWATIRYLFKFYYEGTKQIWKDRTMVKSMRLELAERKAKTGEGIRWKENAIIKQHESDLKKLPLFLAILLILEEVLPLLVIYAPSLLPSTCVLPSQSAKMRSGEERLRGLAIQDLAKNDAVRRVVDELVSSQSTQTKTKDGQEELSLVDLGPDVAKQVAPLFGLFARGPIAMTTSRIQRHLQSIELDDVLLLKAFRSRASSPHWKEICESDWLWKACARRGLRAFEADQKTMEQNLIAYLHLVSCGTRSFHQRALLPLALYDGTMQDLIRLQVENKEEHAKGIRKRTMEVVEEVTATEKKKESK